MCCLTAACLRITPRFLRFSPPAGVHHHLVREGTRTRIGLLLETGEARQVHHMCLLLGFGAEAINPYLVFETIDDMIRNGLLENIEP